VSERWPMFLSRDPAVADENLYRYCGNDPLDATDPSGLKEKKTFNDLLGKFECMEMSRENFESWVGRNMYKLTPAQRAELDKGCIGLCAINQASDPTKGPYADKPEKAPGTQCYLSEAEATQRKCAPGQINFVFAKIGQWNGGNKPTPSSDGTIPSNSIEGIGSKMVPDPSDPTAEPIYYATSAVRYVTFIDGFYFEMNCSKIGGSQTVKICRKAPTAEQSMWCSTCKCTL